MTFFNFASLIYFFMPFNWIPLIAMLKLTLGITIVAIIAKMAILAMAIGVINMAILGIQLKSIKKTSSVVLDSYQSDLPFRHYQKKYVCNFYAIFTM